MKKRAEKEKQNKNKDAGTGKNIVQTVNYIWGVRHTQSHQIFEIEKEGEGMRQK